MSARPNAHSLALWPVIWTGLLKPSWFYQPMIAQYYDQQARAI
jgi:hypothetical protein